MEIAVIMEAVAVEVVEIAVEIMEAVAVEVMEIAVEVMEAVDKVNRMY